MVQPVSDQLFQNLEATRKDLLDLGLKNSLINYPASRGIKVVEELPREVFRILVGEKKQMYFIPDPTLEKQARFDLEASSALRESKPVEENWPSPYRDFNSDQPLDRKYTDLKLQTRLSPAALKSQLLKTYLDYRTGLEEQGANLLYLALGMVEWYEADSSQLARLAPLVLVPVELFRSDVRERFCIKWTEEDIGDNLSLKAKLESEFSLKLPSLADQEEIELDGYFSAVEKTLVTQSRWRVDREAVVLGFFSFGKFLLYKDLDPLAWPTGAGPADHPILKALFGSGFSDPPGLLGENENLDRHQTAVNLPAIVDADSSQTLAILDTAAGRNLVIHGPPGTGKSQTIANLVAQALAQNKSVLFVSEKMDALEVVKRRLDQAGLGQACLELHSHKVNKKYVLVELYRALDLAELKNRPPAQDWQLLQSDREQLNAYCEAVNTPVGGSGLTPYRLTGELARFDRKPESASLPRLDITGAENWAEAEYRRLAGLCDQLAAFLGKEGLPAGNPFSGSYRVSLLPSEKQQALDLTGKARGTLNSLVKLGEQLAAPLKLPAPAAPQQSEVLQRLAGRIAGAPDLKGINVTAREWLAKAEEIGQLINGATTLVQLYRDYSASLKPEAWNQDVTAVRQSLETHGRNFFTRLNQEYKTARLRLEALCTGPLPSEPSRQIELVNTIQQAQQLQAAFNQGEGLGRFLFQNRWQGLYSDWQALSLLAGWLRDLHLELSRGQLPPSLLEYLAGIPDVSTYKDTWQRFGEEITRQQTAFTELVTCLALDRTLNAREFTGQPYQAQLALLDRWQNRLDELQVIVTLNALEQQFKEAGLEPVFRVATGWSDSPRLLTLALREKWLEALLERALRERSALARFNGETHRQVIGRFREMDRQVLSLNRSRLADNHFIRVNQAKQDEDPVARRQLDLIRQNINKKSRIIPIRKLIQQAGPFIQRIKPVFMMSPLSIATFVPPGTLEFDLVIFDEASQVRPADAFGAIIRGKQVVVAGDDKQLPPTSFFDKLVDPTEDEDEEEQDSGSYTRTGEFESILTLFKAKSPSTRLLRWHYRSRHESLIAASNQEFYANRLIVFPSPDKNREATGLVYHHLPNTAYDRGGSRTNRLEAEAVALAVMDHARSYPDYTLGVATFSITQRNAIVEILEKLRAEEPDLESFFNDHPQEPFFVKNLEHVQGDERDVILISTGYGKDANGKVTMNFGPVNQSGGERRLNVLFSRARLRCEIFTNLVPDDIRVDLSKSEGQQGLKVLRTFLEFARSGSLSIPTLTGRPQDSPFEEAVLEALVAKGYRVDAQVGQAGYFIDLAVVDPEKPGRYLLGIECDGATYHSAKAARDRDRLRHQVLEGLGWDLYHIWSTDWFRNPARELQRVIETIEQTHRRKQLEEIARNAGLDEQDDEDDPLPADGVKILEVKPVKYETARLEIDGWSFTDISAVNPQTIAGWVSQIVRVESPVHLKEVTRRIASATGQSRIDKYVLPGINLAVSQGSARLYGDFLWLPEMGLAPVRNRTGLAATTRKLEMIPPQELNLAIYKVVADAKKIDRVKVPEEVCRLLGLGRLSVQLDQFIQNRVDSLVDQGKFRRQGNLVELIL